MTKVAVIGCGVVGAAIAYELSRVGLSVTLLDKHSPASGSTGAALGVLMGAISHKKGRAWQLRQASLQRYETLIPELEAIAGSIPFNRQGIVVLGFAQDNWEKWRSLVEIRRSQGWRLEMWDRSQVEQKCPQLDNQSVVGAIYSPQDRQVNPTRLTQALVAGAVHYGAECRFGVEAEQIVSMKVEPELRHCYQMQTTTGTVEFDWLVISAGLGSTPLTASLQQSTDIRPVLGQALQLKLERPLGDPDFQPVITVDDVHIVPLNEREYWIGATVEFPGETEAAIAQPTLLEQVRQEAIAFCPALAHATVVRTWSGSRPRPYGQPAPLIGPLPGYSNVLLATGHYRNGVLLAPATAEVIREAIMTKLSH